MGIKIRNQEYVLAIWNERSFTLAAEKMRITQPSISRHIQDIENEIGYPIFDRSFKPVRLTQVGELYIKTAEEIVRLENDLNNMIREIANLKAGTLKLGVTPTGARYYLPEFLPGYLKRYPDIKSELKEGSTAELEMMLRRGVLDVIITPKLLNDKSDPFPKNDALAFQKYKRENCYLMTPKGYFPKEEGHSFTYDYIREKLQSKTHKIIILCNGQKLRQLSDTLIKKDGLSMEVVYETSSGESAYKLCANGVGLTFTVDSIKKHISYHLLPDFYLINDYFRLVMVTYRRNAPLPRPAYAFLQYMDEKKEKDIDSN